MGSGNSVPVDNSWKQFQQMSQLFNQNNQNQRGFNVHMPVHLDKIVDLSRSYTVGSEDELTQLARDDIVAPAVVRPGETSKVAVQRGSSMSPLTELESAMEPLAAELQEALGESGSGGPQAAAQVGGLDLEIDFSQQITLPTPLVVDWTADATGLGAGIGLSGFLAGLGGGAALVCLVAFIMWKCFRRQSSAR